MHPTHLTLSAIVKYLRGSLLGVHTDLGLHCAGTSLRTVVYYTKVQYVVTVGSAHASHWDCFRVLGPQFPHSQFGPCRRHELSCAPHESGAEQRQTTSGKRSRNPMPKQARLAALVLLAGIPRLVTVGAPIEKRAAVQAIRMTCAPETWKVGRRSFARPTLCAAGAAARISGAQRSRQVQRIRRQARCHRGGRFRRLVARVPGAFR